MIWLGNLTFSTFIGSVISLCLREKAPHCVVLLLWHSLSRAPFEKTVTNLSKWQHFSLIEIPCY